MKAISVRQPDAWFITQGIKDIENRTWATSHRGWVLIHASGKKMTKADREYLRDTCEANGIPVPADLDMGGVVGVAYLLDCVDSDNSVWFDGPIGWVLTNATSLPFRKTAGKLGLFDIPGFSVDGDDLIIPSE
jgi:hypothetical protein